MKSSGKRERAVFHYYIVIGPLACMYFGILSASGIWQSWALRLHNFVKVGGKKRREIKTDWGHGDWLEQAGSLPFTVCFGRCR